MAATNNHLTLAVAGSRKTQGIVDACAAAGLEERILILTYTAANQVELKARIARCAGDNQRVEVAGWFAFLLSNFVRPFVPFVYPGVRLRGFDFHSPPQTYTTNDSRARYFNDHGEARRVHLPQLATRIEEASEGACARRLGRVYDRIFIDEVQDLCGYDLEVLKILMRSRVEVEMVGDIRQAILATNEREKKNKKYMYMKIWDWFRGEEHAGRLSITQSSETWRCGSSIASLADSLFDDQWGFEPTTSRNTRRTDHDGIFLVRPQHVARYVETFSPLTLRNSAASGKALELTFINFGEAKGLDHERVLICPTAAIEALIRRGKSLEPQQAAKFYVAITRAEQSVAIILEDGGESVLEFWEP